jgi:hypothetical protein
MVLGCGVAGLAGLAFCWGRNSAQCQTPAAPAPAAAHKPGELVPEAPLAPESGSDYSRRVVAYIYKNIPITREDLGEFLIARYGPDKVEALVNRKVVDLACQSRGIRITDAEVEATLAEDVKGLGISIPDFEKKLLRPRHTSLYSWKEDVIRPKLALTQFCRDRVQVTDEDVQKAFETHYGPKVQCRMILIRNREDRHRFDLWARVSKSAEEFDREARQQEVQFLAAKGGEVPPISRHCGDERIERQAFSLKPGEVSQLIDTPDGVIILKCVGHLPPDATKKIDTEREALKKEILDQKILQEIPKVLKELRAQAEPKLFIRKQISAEELYRDVKRTAGMVGGNPGANPPGPQGR